jgi:hypothetical protein
MAKDILSDILTEVCAPLPLPPDNVNLKKCVGSLTESAARQLFARLALYNLDIVILPAGNKPGNCLFHSVLHSIKHPVWYSVLHFRMELVWYLVKNVGLIFKRLQPSLIAKGISYYTLCKRMLLSGEWGGLETLLFIRFQWKVPLTVICPGHDQQMFHSYGVRNAPLVIAYNGSSHYMPLGEYSL